MTDIVYRSFINELKKIAAEGPSTSSADDPSAAKVDHEDTSSKAIKEIFDIRELTRIRQAKDESDKPAMAAHGSPILTDREAAEKSHGVGRSQGYQEAAREGVQIAAKVGKRSYDTGYSSAAKEGVGYISKAYLRGRNESA